MTEAERIAQLATELERIKRDIKLVQDELLSRGFVPSKWRDDPAFLRAKKLVINRLGVESEVFQLAVTALAFQEICKDEPSDNL